MIFDNKIFVFMGRKKGVANKIPKGAKKIIKDNNIKVGSSLRYKDDCVKYDMKTFLRVYEGYDILENFMIVRFHIQYKYKVTIHELDILLYLFPKSYFTSSDYLFIPRKYSVRSVRIMLKRGLFAWVMKPKILEGRPIKELEQFPDGVFTLSARAKTIVASFYKCLVGEEKIDTDETQWRSIYKLHSQRLKVMDFLNESRNPEKFEELYKKNSE